MGNLISTYFGDISTKGRIWNKARVIWPHRNVFTGKRLMPFTRAVRARLQTPWGPSSISYGEYIAYWTTPEELVIQKLKGNA